MSQGLIPRNDAIKLILALGRAATGFYEGNGEPNAKAAMIAATVALTGLGVSMQEITSLMMEVTVFGWDGPEPVDTSGT